MSQVLLIALAASIPLAALSLFAAWTVEAMGADVRLRLCAWTAALLLPAVPAPAMLAIHALNIPSPFAASEPRTEPVVMLIEPTAQLAPAPAPRPASKLPIAALLLGLAGAGAALRLGQLALGLRRVARLKAGSQAISDPELAARLGRGVRLADTETPVLAGLKRPTILLPRRLLDGLSPEQAAFVCAHERAHLAAGDHLSHLMEETMVRVFWFNPFMAAARERLAAAREEACDARALHGCDTARRRAYAQTLIAALKLAGPAEPVAAFTGFRRRGAERRLKAILKPTGPGSSRAFAAAILAGLGLTAVVGGFSLAAAAEPPAPVASQPLPPPPPVPPAPSADAAPPAPPAPAPHIQSIIVTRHGPHGAPVDHAMVWDGKDWKDMSKLTPEERARMQAEMDRAHAEMAKHGEWMANVHPLSAEDQEKIHQQVEDAMKVAHEAMGKVRPLTAEEQAKIHKQVEEAMTQAHQAMQLAQSDGRVLMRCKLGPDGKAQDCVKAFPGPVMRFELKRMGPDGAPLPPMPPMPGVAPPPPLLPPPPAVG